MRYLAATLLIFALFLSGCEKKGDSYRPSSQELRLNIAAEPPTLDPRKAGDSVSVHIVKMCFEGLTRLGMEGTPELAAAESFEVSEDNLHYTFKLRDAKWSDGAPVTAFDFEKTWKTMLDPVFPCEFALDLYIIKNARAAKMNRCSMEEIGVRALDANTLQIDLEHPVPYFLSALASHVFFPCPSHVAGYGIEWTHQNYVGNGAFRLSEWRHYDRIVVEKNPYYWDKDAVQLDKISLMMIEDPITTLSMYENGEIDWVGFPLNSLPEDAIPLLKKQGNLNQLPIAGVYFYVFNTEAAPFQNCNMRRAFSLAINRKAIIDNILQTGQTVATGIVPPCLWKTEAKTFFADHDLPEARRLFQAALRELNLTKEELPPLSLSYNTGSAHHKIAQAIQQQWKEAFDVDVTLENKEWKVFLDELRLNQFQIARLGGLGTFDDPLTFLDNFRYLSSSGNKSQWTNPRYSEILERADVTTDLAARTVLLQSAEKIMIDEMPIAPIYFYTGSYLVRPYVKNICLSEINDVDFKWTYVEIGDQ